MTLISLDNCYTSKSLKFSFAFPFDLSGGLETDRKGGVKTVLVMKDRVCQPKLAQRAGEVDSPNSIAIFCLIPRRVAASAANI